MKKKSTWYWDDVLQALFEESRTVMKISEGIELYDKEMWTVFITDYY